MSNVDSVVNGRNGHSLLEAIEKRVLPSTIKQHKLT